MVILECLLSWPPSAVNAEGRTDRVVGYAPLDWVESRPFQFHGTDVRRGYEAENCAPGRPISQLCMGDYENPPMQPESDAYGALALAIGGGFQVPSRIEGGVSFGQ